MSVVKNIEIENQNYDIYGKNLQNVTWQEYEAIEDKNDDKAYFITDVPPSEQKKTAVKPLPTGSISTVNDAAELPLNALKVSVEAQQDLHGYDHPWIGGAGKNKLPLTVDGIKAANTDATWNGNIATVNGVTFTLHTDNAGNITRITINGTTTSSTSGSVLRIPPAPLYAYNGQSVIISTLKTDIQETNYRFWLGDSSYNTKASVRNGESTFTMSSDITRVWVQVTGGTITNLDVYPMLRLATETDPTFEPYSNICPISGWSTVTITDKDDLQNPTETKTYTHIFTDAQGNPLTVYGAEWDVVGGGMKSSYRLVTFVDANDFILEGTDNFYMDVADATPRKLVTCSALRSVRTYYIQGSANAWISSSGRFNITIPSIPHTLQGLNDYLTSMANEGKPLQVMYKLATPQTIPQQAESIRMLEGVNNLYADCGEVIEGEYFGNNTNQIRVNDEIIAGGNSVTFAAESKYAEHAEVAEVANNIQNIDYDDYDSIVDKDNDIAYIVNDVPSSESGSNYFKDLPTGSISTVNDAAELPLNALKVSVEAVQSGSGTPSPSNIRPIHGWNKCYLADDPVYTDFIYFNQLVKNGDFSDDLRWDWSKVSAHSISSNVATITFSNDEYNHYIEQNINTTNGHKYLVTAVLQSTNKPTNARFILGSKSYWISDNISSRKKVALIATAVANDYQLYIRFSDGSNGGQATIENVMMFDLTAMFGAGNEPTLSEFEELFPNEYYAYNSGEKTIVSKVNENPYVLAVVDFPSTIYGAEWDVVDGGMTEGYRYAEYDGSEAWELNPRGVGRFYLDELPSGISITDKADSISNQAIYLDNPNAYGAFFVIGGEGIYINRLSESETLQGLQTRLSNEKFTIKYKLATPTTIDLSPLSIRMLQGTNNIYADCGEVLEGEYCTNTSNQLCINDKVVSGDRMVPQSLVSKYSDYSTHADKADDSTHADIADNACTFSVDENGLLTISLVSGDSNNSLSSTRSVKSTTTLPPEEEIKDESVEEKPLENESGITDETENEPSVEEEKDNDEGGEGTPPEQNMR